MRHWAMVWLMGSGAGRVRWHSLPWMKCMFDWIHQTTCTVTSQPLQVVGLRIVLSDLNTIYLMGNLKRIVVSSCFFCTAPVVFAFHASSSYPKISIASLTTSRTSLFYKNKTDSFFDPPVAVTTNEMIYSDWGVYEDTTIQDDSRSRKTGMNDYDTHSNDEGENWDMDYYEDGTSFVATVPTLDLLKSWTQEYIDSIDLAGGMTRISVGVQNMLSSDFVFTSPTIGPLSKEDYVKLMDYYRHCGLDLASAIPDLTVTYDGWHIDPHQPWRVWVVARYSGTHLGTAVVPGTDLKLTPPNTGDHDLYFTSGPEMQSFLWTPDKEILWQTMGYVGDEYTGSNQGYGALDGLLVSMGLPHLYLDATSPMRKVKNWFSQFQTDNGETMARAKTPYSRLPQWWNERKSYDLNVHK